MGQEVKERTQAEVEVTETTMKSETRKDFCLKLLAVLTMPLEGIFFFGILIGWPNLAELYKEAGVYESLCDKYIVANVTDVTNLTQPVTINCPERDVIFSAVGTLGSVTYNCMALPLGYILDNYGTFQSRSIGTGQTAFKLSEFGIRGPIPWTSSKQQR